ncbi:MAG TPA: sodium-dependent transporter [Anaerolineaceae bacterium]|nr:sodium-dependent transporter [Anaerolineaceae bacterium]
MSEIESSTPHEIPAQAGTPPTKRDSFTSKLGVIAATLGSAVGLGNIWKFPSMTGTNGGAAFIIIYLICTLLVSVPVMITELMLGRTARANAITTYQRLSPKKSQPWWLIGASGVLAAFLILAFYTEVAGWVFAYVTKAIGGNILSTDPEATSAVFGKLITSPGESLMWQWIVLAWISLIIILGVSKGIERMTKRLMPALFVILVIVCVRSLTLPGAIDGVEFLFKPDFSRITPGVFLAAMGLAFFKLSVGMGTMTTYGSYYGDDQDIPGSALKVMLSDLSVSILAGLAIFPAVFAFGFKPDSGPSLLFITLPAVFASMPFGQFFMILFSILAAIAATGAMLSLMEVPVSYLAERTKLNRTQATILTFVLLAAFGATAALSNSLLADVKIAGKTFFDLYDFISSSLLLPIGGFFLAVFAGWVWGYPKVRDSLSNHGVLKNEKAIKAYYQIVRYVAPVLILLVLLNGLGLIKW